MNNLAAFRKGLAGVFGKATICVKGDVRGERGIGIEPDFATTEVAGKIVRMAEEHLAEALALMIGMHGEILDQQMTLGCDCLDQSLKTTVDLMKIDHMRRDGPLVIGGHRQRLSSDQRHPFGIGEARKHPDGVDIGKPRTSKRSDRG
jgi:hypothetical protein